MLEVAFHSVGTFLSGLPFTGATWFVLATLAFFIFLFARANKNPASPVKWEHLLIDSNNDRASPYKVGYLIGVIVSTWIVLTFVDSGKLTFDILGTYLTYLLGGAGVNSFAKSRSEQIAYADQLDPTMQRASYRPSVRTQRTVVDVDQELGELPPEIRP